MSLEEKISNELNQALKDRDEVKVSTLRMLKSAIKYASIAQGKELTDQDVIVVIQKEIKQRKDSVEQYTKASRQDLADKEQSEIAILEPYLPAQLPDEELKNIIAQAITSANAQGPQDTGKVMAQVMPQVKGRADGARVSALVQEALKHG